MKVDRGEVWIVDLGYTGKTRPCVVLSQPPEDVDRSLITLVPFTTQARRSRFEVAVESSIPALRKGVVDAQNLITVPPPKLLRKLGTLSADLMLTIEEAVRRWLCL